MLNPKMARITSCALMLCWLFVPSSAIAKKEEEVRCEWYVKRALQHAQINFRKKCGYSGPEWDIDSDKHAKWCAKASPEQIKDVMNMRSQAIEACSQ